MEPESFFEGAQLVTDWFGRWPSLHDAEVISVVLNRETPNLGPSLHASVHGFQMTSEITDGGYYKLIKHCLIQFRFEGVDQLHLDDFNFQNVIDGISVSTAPEVHGKDRTLVEFDSLYGMELSFTCDKGQVLSIEPFAPKVGVHA